MDTKLRIYEIQYCSMPSSKVHMQILETVRLGMEVWEFMYGKSPMPTLIIISANMANY